MAGLEPGEKPVAEASGLAESIPELLSAAERCAQIDDQIALRDGAPGTHPQFDRVVRMIWRLRQPDGCPWDREQTHASFSRDLVEEAYEGYEAIREGSREHLMEELGDLLENILLHAQIDADEGGFDIDDVCQGLHEKLVRRHPHVFGNVARAGSADEALDAWDGVKRVEREGAGRAGLLDSVPVSLPALMQCQKVSRRAAKAGFEWDSVDDVWDQFASERLEFLAEEPGSEARAMEFGDMLFALVNVARHEGIDAEEALAASNAKFRRRWAAMETMAREEGRDIEAYSTAEQNELWNKAKAME